MSSLEPLSFAFNIRDFGAIPDRKTLASPALQKAIDAAADAGGGVVYCPPGDYLIGSIELKSNINLHVSAGATLWGSTRKEDYDLSWKMPNPGAQHAQSNSIHLIWARHARNVAITGRGTIDGQGDSFFVGSADDRRLKQGWRPERMIALIACHNVLVEGVHLHNSPGWMLWPVGCEQVRIAGVRIITRRDVPNSDGIDPDCCRDVHISDCHIDTGDDCIALKSSVDMFLEDHTACENITVTNCWMSTTCCAVRIGYEGDGPIRNCVFSNLVFANTRTGINMLVPRDAQNRIEHGPLIDNIRFSNIVMDTRIAWYLWVGDDAVAPGAIRNVSICGIRGTTERACYIGGSRSLPIENIVLSDIDLTVRGSMNDEFAQCVPYPYKVFDWWTKAGIPHAMYCRYVRGLSLSNVRVHWAEASGPWRSALRCEQVENMSVDGLLARQGIVDDAPVVDLTEVRGAFLRGCMAQKGTGRFLRISGPGSVDIVAIGNHLAAAATAFDLAVDTQPGVLTDTANHCALE